MSAPKADVVGAGLAGALMAVLLGKRGWRVDLHEKRPDPRAGAGPAGKSINLALSARGIHALERAGVAAEVLATAVPMRGRMMHALDGTLSFQPYGKSAEEVIHSVSRAGLNIALLDAAEKQAGVRLFFERKCVGADLDAPSADLGPGLSTQGDVVIGSDGAFSAVRGALQRTTGFDYSQTYLEHSYKELTLPAGPDGSFQMEKHALHIWPRGGFMMIALPNADATYTVTVFAPRATLEANEPRALFEAYFPDAIPLMPDLEDQFRANPVGSLVTVRCKPFHHADKVVLLGDAAHAVVPFYGQGMNASFEDCVVLDDCLTQYRDRAAAFAAYSERRKENVDALADLALYNYVEMRDHTASPLFLAKKAFERALARLLPGLYIPLYALVTFTRTPYAQAVRRARRQNVWIAAAAAVLAAALFLPRWMR